MSEMMIRLFVLEDDEKQVKIYKDAIDDFYKKKGVKISAEFSGNLPEALGKIKAEDFDAAIIDLKLSGTDTEGGGNQAIRQIRENLRFPVFVMSGFIDELDLDLREENVFYKTYRSTDKDVSELLQEITDLYNTGITKILGKKGRIEKALQDVFWKHISCSMNYWKSEAKGPKECEKILLRYVLVYLTGYLEMDEAGELLCYNPAEFYIIPPIRKYVFTGDILKNRDDGKRFLVLTPACDMAQGKAKDIMLVYIEDKNMEYVAQQKRVLSEKISGAAGTKEKEAFQKKKDEAEKTLKNLLTNSHSFKYHFLPCTEPFSGGFVNFQKVASIKASEIKDKYERVASVTEKFIKEIIARFSHYYARQGQPDFDIDELMKKM